MLARAQYPLRFGNDDRLPFAEHHIRGEPRACPFGRRSVDRHRLGDGRPPGYLDLQSTVYLLPVPSIQDGAVKWLFDRQRDPYEMTNLAGDPALAQVQQQLEARLRRWIEETDDPFETGRRDPETGMLVLGQRFTHEKWYRA